MNGAAVIQPAPIPFYTVLVLYLGIMAFIGWYAGRKTNNIGDFFVLSGKAGVVVSGIAYFSTQFSMGTFLGTPGTQTRENVLLQMKKQEKPQKKAYMPVVML